MMWLTAARLAASTAATCWASRTPGAPSLSVLMISRRSTPAKAASRDFGSSKSPARTMTPLEARSLSFSGVRVMATILFAPRARSVSTTVRPNGPAAPVTPSVELEKSDIESPVAVSFRNLVSKRDRQLASEDLHERKGGTFCASGHPGVTHGHADEPCRDGGRGARLARAGEDRGRRCRRVSGAGDPRQGRRQMEHADRDDAVGGAAAFQRAQAPGARYLAEDADPDAARIAARRHGGPASFSHGTAGGGIPAHGPRRVGDRAVRDAGQLGQ